MSKTITIPNLASFCTAFGGQGLRVGPRTGANKRTQEDKEWFVVRHFLKAALKGGLFEFPISVKKRAPPAPDFELKLGCGDILTFLEITEATDTADQREMTKFERSNKPMLLGHFGGRLSQGASQPGRPWASDILDAIKRKQGKAIFLQTDAQRHLVIYPNSNASALLTDEGLEAAAFEYLKEAIEKDRDNLVNATNGCLAHVLGKELVCWDLLGNFQLLRRGPLKSAQMEER